MTYELGRLLTMARASMGTLSLWLKLNQKPWELTMADSQNKLPANRGIRGAATEREACHLGLADGTGWSNLAAGTLHELRPRGTG